MKQSKEDDCSHSPTFFDSLKGRLRAFIPINLCDTQCCQNVQKQHYTKDPSGEPVPPSPGVPAHDASARRVCGSPAKASRQIGGAPPSGGNVGACVCVGRCARCFPVLGSSLPDPSVNSNFFAMVTCSTLCCYGRGVGTMLSRAWALPLRGLPPEETRSVRCNQRGRSAPPAPPAVRRRV